MDAIDLHPARKGSPQSGGVNPRLSLATPDAIYW